METKKIKTKEETKEETTLSNEEKRAWELATEDIQKMNIYQKMDLVRVYTGIIAKNINLMSYKAVAESDIIKKVNEAEHKARLYSYQYDLEALESNTLGENKWIRIKCLMKCVNIDKPEEYVLFCGYGDGLDKGDKACGKANTYAMKYALMRGYKIPTGEDPDYFKSENEQMATEKEIAEYVELIGGENNIPLVCKKIGVHSLNELSLAEIKTRIENLKKYKKEHSND